MDSLVPINHTTTLKDLLHNPTFSTLDSFYNNTYCPLPDEEKKILLNSLLLKLSSLHTHFDDRAEKWDIPHFFLTTTGTLLPLLIGAYSSYTQSRQIYTDVKLGCKDNLAEQADINSRSDLVIALLLSSYTLSKIFIFSCDQKMRSHNKKILTILENLKADKKRLNNESVQ